MRRRCGYTDLTAVKVNKPNIVWHFEIRFVEEEAGWYTNNVGSRSKKELPSGEESSVRHNCYGTTKRQNLK